MAKKKKITLARLGDPYVLGDGRIIPPEQIRIDENEEIPELTASEFRPLVQRSTKDLPAPTASMNGIACVLIYSVLGLGAREIAEAMGVSADAVERAKESQPYEDTFKLIAGEFINANSNFIDARIAAYGHGALTSLAKVALQGKQEGNVMRASMDLLDRGGHSKKDVRGMNGANDLRIVVTKGDEVINIEMGNLGEM